MMGEKKRVVHIYRGTGGEVYCGAATDSYEAAFANFGAELIEDCSFLQTCRACWESPDRPMLGGR